MSYDYIIVGGGISGLFLSYQLSKDSNKSILLFCLEVIDGHKTRMCSHFNAARALSVKGLGLAPAGRFRHNTQKQT